MKIEGDKLIFSSGKEVYCHNGIVGLDDQGNITEGCDGGIEEKEMTTNEQLELIDYMINNWIVKKLKFSRSYFDNMSKLATNSNYQEYVLLIKALGKKVSPELLFEIFDLIDEIHEWKIKYNKIHEETKDKWEKLCEKINKFKG